MTEQGRTSGSRGAGLAIAGLSAVAGFALVYVLLGQPQVVRLESPPDVERQAKPDTPAAAAAPHAAPAGSTKLNQGHMTAFVFRKEPEALPEITFTDGAGKPMSLADFKGRKVLLNLWATWCAPCRKEMPALERLQKELGSERFEVVALSVDRGGIEASKKFLDQIKVSALGLYVDATGRANATLRAVGLPTTLLIDEQGREIGRLVGPAEWDSEDAKRLVRGG
jgi:thiol-disulfide isomerase/thioredoxin